jgi:hypothetical protein
VHRGFGIGAFSLGCALLVTVGCRGSVDRVFFDDEADAAPEEASTDATTPEQDAIAPTDGDGDGRDGGGDASTSADVQDASSLDAADAPPTYAIGGTVVGLNGSGLVLLDNGGDALPVVSAGQTTTFKFPGRLRSGDTYDVSIQTQPSNPAQSCVLAGASGTVQNGDVSSVVVNCGTNTYTIGGTVSGLAGTLVLANNGGDDLTLTSDGSFAFSVPVASQSTYDVTVVTQPGSPKQNCVLSNATGTVQTAPVTSVSVACTTYTYSVGGNISGLTTAGVVLQNNGGDNLSVPANGPFTFATPVQSGKTYDVRIFSAPADKTCPITNGTGTVTAGPITNVVVSCYTKTLLSENFDGIVPPVLPVGWSSAVAIGTGGDSPWVTSTSVPYSAPNDAFVNDVAHATDIHLDSPSFHVDTTTATLQFRATWSLEPSGTTTGTGFDGVVLEISIAGGAFQDILLAGGSFSSGAYDHTISTQYQSTIPGRQAWSGTSSSYTLVGVNLPAAAAGNNVVLRWRMGTDKQTFGAVSGYRLDSIVVLN